MKKSLVLVLSFLIVAVAFGQNFEGKIIYRNTYKSKTANVSDEQWSSMLGAKQEYFIKGGNYKSVMNGSMMQWQLYINTNNKIFSKIANSETALWNDGSENKDTVLEYTLTRGVAEVFGFRCDELVLRCNSGMQKYYFNTKLKVDTSLYVKHKFGNWAAYISKAAALPLKTIIENSQLILESVAVEVVPMKLTDETFALPTGIKTTKSPY